MINYIDLKETIDSIDNDTTILISGHTNADHDSICSSLALACFLNKLGKKSFVLLSEKDMDKTRWLNTKYIINDHNLSISDNNYVFILLDANRKNRLGAFEKLFEKANFTINIDHHENNANEADYIFTDETMSSVSEILFDLMSLYNDIVDKEIATYLYSGIASDTNSFYKRTTPKNMLIASKLLEYDIDAEYIIKETCKTLSLAEANILADMIKNITFNKLHYIVLDRNNPLYTNIPYSTIFKKCASYIYEICDIKVLGIFLIELDGSISGLLRSNCNIDVDSLAKEFGGGGHKKASGFETNMDIHEIVDRTINYVADNLN